MKRIYIAIALMALAVAGSLWTHSAFKKETNSLISGLYELLSFAEDGSEERLKTQTDEYLKRWEKASPLLHVITLHSEMDSAEQRITSLPDLIESRDLAEYKLACIEAISQLRNLQDSEKFSIDNILRFSSDFTLCSQFASDIQRDVFIIEKYHNMLRG